MKSRRCDRPLLVVALLSVVGLIWGSARADMMPPIPPDREPVVTSPFLLKHTDVRSVVTGPVAHVIVTQTWENPNQVPVDGLYIFPLPENAAVNDMSLTIGERRIRAQMKRREEARRIYEEARQQGRVAGLLDQERPNVFVQRVANIMPGMRIEVELVFDQPILCEDGLCDYAFPTVVGPRFVPEHQADPGLINPPVVEPGHVTGQTLGLQVELDTGVSMRDLESPSHRVTIAREGTSRASVTLVEGEGAALNRDFRLRWRVGAEAPEVGLLAWRDPAREGEPGVFTLIIQPPAAPADEQIAPRELFFVLDCSGSMSGMPLVAAKNVVRKAIGAVRPNDTFQIIRFSENASGLGTRPLTPTPQNIQNALAYLDSLRGQGGTRMIEGIKAALGAPADPERLRIVAFLTDGYIGNESEILGEVRRSLGGARLFSFGIGSSVNRYLLEGLAEEGRGAAAFLGTRETPDEMVERFVKRIDSPVLTDIRLTWEDLAVEDLEPASIPDLFAGQPLVVKGRYRVPGTGLLLVEGRRGDRTEILRRVVILHDQAADNEALGRLWARARIHRLSRELHDGERADLKESIASLGLNFRLMTAYTSLVAVDSIVSNTTGSSQQIMVPVEMPEDVSYEGVFGRASGKMASAGSPAAAEFALATPSFVPPLAQQPRDARAPVSEATELTDKPKVGEDATIVRFTRLTLVEPDGTQLVVEEDGEVWVLAGRTRRLVRALTANQLTQLLSTLSAARSNQWSGAPTGSRIELLLNGTARIVNLPSADLTIQQLARALREAAG